MEFMEMLLQVIDIPAVVLAVVLTQLFRYLLPTPKGGAKFDVNPKLYRWLPILPLIIATVTVIVKDGVWTPTMKLDDSIVKGIVSGAASSYLFRTAKVILFGKNGNGNGNGTTAGTTSGTSGTCCK